MAAQEGGEPDASSGWVDNYVASYRYKYPWGLLIFPILGLLPILLVWRAPVALSVAIGAEVLFILAFVRWKTYCVQLSAGTVSAVSMFRRKTFTLSDVDLIQHLHGDRGGELLRIRHSDRILLSVSQDLDGFDDLVGFFREYARHHNLIFATRDDWDEWTQAGKSSGGDSI
jgi:hypothetical protein